MNKLLTLLLFAACLATAQTQTATYTAPTGQISCYKLTPAQQYYANYVENSTPPYPGVFQPNNFQFPALPNHPIPTCGVAGGYVSPDNLYTATTYFGTAGGQFRIFSNGSQVQVIEIANIVWTVPSDPGAPDTPASISMDATVTAVCEAECDETATGTFHLEGQWAYEWVHQHVRTNPTEHYQKVWTATTPTAVTINAQSVYTIFD